MKLSAIAAAVGGRIENAPHDIEITGLAGIENARQGQLSFISNVKYASLAQTTQAAAIIVAEDFATRRPVLRSSNPYLAFAKALELFYQPPKHGPGVHPTAVISVKAQIGKHAHIGPYCVIYDDVVIGDNAVLLAHSVIYQGARIGDNFFAHANTVVREFCQIGNNVILQNGVVIGADGFGFARGPEGWHKIVQSGIVVIEDNVEVQANATIDRASIGETRIKRDVKVDNLVQVGHGSTVGEHTMLCSQVGLAGSTEVGKNVILAGQVGVAGHCKIGDGAIATAQSGIPNDVDAGVIVSGYPAIENRHWLRAVAVFNKLPELSKTVRKLAKKFGEE